LERMILARLNTLSFLCLSSHLQHSPLVWLIANFTNGVNPRDKWSEPNKFPGTTPAGAPVYYPNPFIINAKVNSATVAMRPANAGHGKHHPRVSSNVKFPNELNPTIG
jgi:hypothetical protein